ncbi:MAG: threonylcarbamoyl-AMP synthase [Acidobacteria bacterium]|nr:threonylcarbamoyl-AMP synthase [Acidobacteriota bacterium]
MAQSTRKVPLTEVLRVDPTRPDPEIIARAAGCLRDGGLVAFPTETVYGLGAHARDPDAIRRLFEAKGRPAHDPLIVHVASLEQVEQVAAAVPEMARALAARFWPGPLTLVLPRGDAVPREVTAGLETVGVRVPSHPVARALLEAARLPIAAPSANLFSRPSPTCAAHVLHDLEGRIDMVLDGGPTTVGVESTVIDLTGDVPTVLRPGAVSLEQLQDVVPTAAAAGPGAFGPSAGRKEGAAPSPGLLPLHYAPRTPLVLYRGRANAVRDAILDEARDALARGERVGILATAEDAQALRPLPVVIAELGPEHDVERVAARLYAALRDLDGSGVDVILVRDFSRERGLGRALRDRLERAASAIRVV